MVRERFFARFVVFSPAIFFFMIFALSVPAFAQDAYFSDWFARVDKSKEEQPHWVTPVATTTPRLEEEYRYDQVWQTNNAGITANNYDGGKGLELIPFEKVEVIFNVPPYIAHNDPAVRDGFGDIAFLLKYRLLSSNEQHGNYILTAFLGLSIPTGDHKNGAPHAVITPTIAYGKGAGILDVQGTFSVAMPTSDTNLLGRSYIWNNALQAHIFRKVWPEVESNATFFQNGANDGRKQNFITPGLVFGKFPLAGRVGLTFGAGFQIATTDFHPTNHNAILTVRFPF
jgi:hypothetical protein